METFIIFAIILLVVIAFGVERLKHNDEAFADLGSHRVTNHELKHKFTNHELKHNVSNYKKELYKEMMKTGVPRSLHRPFFRQVPSSGIGEYPRYRPGFWQYNPLNRYQAPQYIPTVSPECSDYAADRCRNFVPSGQCWNGVYNSCVDGTPSSCEEYVADQCSNSTDFSSCFNFYKRVACPTIY
jgi:hypothetical protein